MLTEQQSLLIHIIIILMHQLFLLLIAIITVMSNLGLFLTIHDWKFWVNFNWCYAPCQQCCLLAISHSFMNQAHFDSKACIAYYFNIINQSFNQLHVFRVKINRPSWRNFLNCYPEEYSMKRLFYLQSVESYQVV